MDEAAPADPRVLEAQRLLAQDGSVVDLVVSVDLRATTTRDVVIDLCNGVFVVGLLRNDLADPELSYTR